MNRLIKLSSKKKTYAQRIIALFGTSLVGYWPLWDINGTVVQDASGNGRNGTYSATGWTKGEVGIGDGCPSVLNNGTNGRITISNDALKAVIETQEFSILACCKVLNAGVWTDGVYRDVFKVSKDANNSMEIYRYAANNYFGFRYKAGGIEEFVLKNPISDTDWMQVVMTVSLSGNIMIGYINGAAVNAGSSGLGTWAAGTTYIYIGAFDTIPNYCWSGWLQHVAIISRVITPTEVAQIAQPFFSPTWGGSDAVIAADGFYNAFPGLVEI